MLTRAVADVISVTISDNDSKYLYDSATSSLQDRNKAFSALTLLAKVRNPSKKIYQVMNIILFTLPKYIT